MTFDLGIAGRRALVCGSSSGLGFACAMNLARAGVAVTLNGRNLDRLKGAAARIAEAGLPEVHFVVADVTTEAGREKLIGQTGKIDILINNAAGPPPGDFRTFSEEQWHDAFNANALSAIRLIAATVDGMIEQRWGRIINITSAAVKEPLAPLALSNTARLALTGFVAGLAREVAGDGVTLNNLLPGSFRTNRLSRFISHSSEESGKSEEQIEQEIIATIPAGRFGDPDDFGAWCAFLSSQQAGHMTGQNILIDGGSYRGTI